MRDADKRRPDGTWIHCEAPGPWVLRSGNPIKCNEVTGHEGDHLNGSFRWPQEEGPE